MKYVMGFIGKFVGKKVSDDEKSQIEQYLGDEIRRRISAGKVINIDDL